MADLKLSIDTSDVPKALMATQRFERQINQLVNRFASGSISQDVYNRGLLQIKRSYETLGLSSQKATSEVRRYAKAQLDAARDIKAVTVAQNQMAAATQRSTRSMGRGQVMIQQTGYQVGDFLVQVQSGTNWMVAFGQQATQVAGTLTLLGGKMVLIGSALGIALPLLTAVGAYFMRTRDASNGAAGGVETFEDRLKSAREEITATALELERMNRGFETTAELTLGQAVAQARERVTNIQDNLRLMESLPIPRTRYGQNLREGQLEEAREALKVAEQELQVLQNQNAQIEMRNRLEEVAGVHAETMLRLENERREALLDAGRIAEEGRQTRVAMAAELEREAELYREIVRFGEDSVQVEALRAEQARLAYQAKVQETTTNDVLIEQMMALYDETQAAADEADRVNEALGAISALNNLPFTAQVEALAHMLGVAADEALRLMNNLPVGITYGDPNALSGMSGEEAIFGGQEGDIRTRRGSSGGGGGGGSEVETIEQIIEARKEQIAQEIELARLRGNELRIREIQLELENEYQGEINQTVLATIASASERIAAEERVLAALEEQREAYQSIADTLESSLTEGIMSMIDGTKSVEDAFKEMARSVIAELYRVLVVQRLVGSFDSTTGTGSGIVGAIAGAFFPGRASGGSITSGQPYIVGEKGPELIIPSRSGTVLNADLTRKGMSGTDSVSVVNNINVTGGNDPSAIRMELVKLMPQITNATKSAVIDARKRGGQMKAAFG